MKRIPYILAGSLALYTGTIQADDDLDVDLQNAGSEEMINANNDDKAFRISLRGDWIGEAKVEDDDFGGKLKFYEAEVEFEGVVYYNPCYKEGVALGISYNTVHLDWNRNPYFDETNFPEVSLSVSLFTKRACNWLWQAQATLNWQTKKHTNSFSDYTNYDLLLWGRYEYCPDTFFLHAGFVAQTGMKIDRIYPIVGFDWVISEVWKLNAIFPLNVSLVYSLSDCWTVDLAGRFWNARRRVSKDEALSEGLFKYRNSGVELGTTFDNGCLKINGHIGYSFGGVLTISDHNNKHKQHIDFGSAPYIGGELVYRF